MFVGVLFSLRAAIVQWATQNITAALMTPIVIVAIVISLIGAVLPGEWKARSEEFIVEPVIAADFT